MYICEMLREVILVFREKHAPRDRAIKPCHVFMDIDRMLLKFLVIPTSKLTAHNGTLVPCDSLAMDYRNMPQHLALVFRCVRTPLVSTTVPYDPLVVNIGEVYCNTRLSFCLIVTSRHGARMPLNSFIMLVS